MLAEVILRPQRASGPPGGFLGRPIAGRAPRGSDSVSPGSDLRMGTSHRPRGEANVALSAPTWRLISLIRTGHSMHALASLLLYQIL